MDIRELEENTKFQIRHPWELARVSALKTIINRELNNKSALRILDIGCGDGYILSTLCKQIQTSDIDAVDNKLDSIKINKFSSFYPNITFHTSLNTIGKKTYDLIFMFDVLEHIEDDLNFLLNIARLYAGPKTKIFITVPAFQWLFSSHDLFLNHYRRYSLAQLIGLIKKCDLMVDRSGYLYFLVLPLRIFILLQQKIKPGNRQKSKGIGSWNYPVFLTKTIATILKIDNSISLYLNRLGIKIPGLTAWIICTKSPS